MMNTDDIEYQSLNQGHGILIKRDLTHGRDKVPPEVLSMMMQNASHTLAQQCYRLPPRQDIGDEGEITGAQGMQFICGHRGLPAIPGATLIAEVEYISQN